MFERFAAPTRRILVEAEAEARELGHHFIDSQHLVIAMLVPDPDTNSAVRALLLSSGLDIESLRAVVADSEPRRISAPIIGTIPFTPQCKKVLELSFREALQHGSHEIQPEHLLLGVLRDHRSAACILLDAAGITADGVRAWLANPATAQHERHVRTGKSWLPFGGRSTVGARHVLAGARQAAGDTEPVGSQHILLGLVDESQSLGARVLSELGVTREAVAAKIAELGVNGTTDGPPPLRVLKVRNGVEVRIDDPELAERLSAIDAATAGDLIRKALLDNLERGAKTP